MPVYNGAPYLPESIESVLSQTLTDLELVVVDDGSRDATRAIVEGFARSDPRIRLIAHDENEGVTSARNDAWRGARAPYIAVLDSDDVALPDRLARQVEYLDARPSVAAVGGAVVT
jgi:glycosyltransferase involved in cell wall biosynthesis